MTKAQNAQPLTKKMVHMSLHVGHMTGAMIDEFSGGEDSDNTDSCEGSFENSDSEDNDKDGGVIRADNRSNKLKEFVQKILFKHFRSFVGRKDAVFSMRLHDQEGHSWASAGCWKQSPDLSFQHLLGCDLWLWRPHRTS